jgi:demethylmenaquinone methyltransferase/2-methoxy-6-polyprenyl-1,4-benzoquinol methylase/phosphoethanolamine N-methyltransferase
MTPLHREDTGEAPSTEGKTIHYAGRYDLGYALLFGVDRRLWRMVLELARVAPGENLLDIGCGTGRLVLAAGAAVGPSGEAHGIDAAPEMISVARRKASRAGAAVHFSVGAFEDMPFEDGHFDVLTSTLVMHHLPAEVKRKGFSEARRVTKPGGRFIAVDYEAPEAGLPRFLSRLFLGHHMGNAQIRNSLDLLREAGFTDLESGRTSISWLSFVGGSSPSP